VESLAKAPKEAPLEKICLLGCGISTGWGAVWNTADVEEGATAVVFGLGAVGLSVVEGLVKRKASKVLNFYFCKRMLIEDTILCADVIESAVFDRKNSII